MKKDDNKPQVNYGLICLALLILITSCSPKRNLVYFSDLPTTTDFSTPVKNYTPPKIQADDILSISVSSLNAESNVLFNNVLLPANNNSNVIAEKIDDGYLVDKGGAINFPVIGKISLAGLTKEQATEKMTDLIKQHVKNPIVNIRYLNFKVTVIGEVTKPATFVVDTDKINVLEALGLAGDMTAFGKRENVLIIREKDGVRTTARINLNNKDVLSSPFFYLQQNDVVYVEPENKSKLSQANNVYIGLWAAIISSVAFIAITVIDNMWEDKNN